MKEILINNVNKEVTIVVISPRDGQEKSITGHVGIINGIIGVFVDGRAQWSGRLDKADGFSEVISVTPVN